MKSGWVKRATVLVGLTVVLLAVALLTYPVSGGDLECGSVLIPGNRFVPPQTYSRQCDAPMRRRRWVGGAILVLGSVAVVGAGPRSLVAAD